MAVPVTVGFVDALNIQQASRGYSQRKIEGRSYFGNFLFRSDISFLGGKPKSLEKIYRPRVIFNILGPPCMEELGN